MKISALIQNHYCETLYELAKVADQRGVILELGVGSWGSGVWMCEGARLGTQCEVYGVDNFSMEGTSITSVLSDMRARGLYERLLIMSTQDAAKIWKCPISLLFIDADHTYQSCKDDFSGFYDFVIDGGFIVFHDSERPEVKKVIAEVQHLLCDGVGTIDDDKRGCYFAIKK